VAHKKNDTQGVRCLSHRFIEFCEMFEHHFIVRGKDVGSHARSYLSGLMGTQRRKNIERIESDVADSNYQGMQQFLSDSPWSHEALMRQVADEAEAVLGRHSDTALYLDESSFLKKGKASVGVKRQYCGRVGKLENCQVGVFLSLGAGAKVAPVDFRLFLPEEWAQDTARCAKAKVPEAHRRHLTKTELALEMIKQAKARGSTHRWIGGDEVYGNNHSFTNALEDLGDVFLMDVARTMRVWTEDPAPAVPVATAPKGRGRKAQKPRAQTPGAALTVAALTEARFEAQARSIEIRDSTKGRLHARVWAARVWQWDGDADSARPRWLIVRQDADGAFKYSLSNCDAQTTWERMAYMQAQRYWIERGFQDAKSELGMAQYEVRGWTGWHHHQALVCLAQLFLLKQRVLLSAELPLLSARDMVELLAFYLPRRPRTETEVIRQLQQRHAARQSDIDRRKSSPISVLNK
jgi:SRSO17 transposase